jgi:hypothetical protein
MTDPFKALREPVTPVDPDPDFAGRLRLRLTREVFAPPGTPSQACLGTTTDANWYLHLCADPSCLSRPAAPSGPALPAKPPPLVCVPCRPARRTGDNSAAGDLATQRSGNDEADHGLSSVGDGGRGLGP